jgi:predicted DCC family thiol-disulfide oxidoreductase YuxK
MEDMDISSRQGPTAPAAPDSDSPPGAVAAEGGCATVYYDGACPLCSREIATYRRLEGADDLRWVDITTAPPEAFGEGLTREQALSRFHVRDEQGRLVSGAAGFVAIWHRLPGLRWLARVAARPPVAWLLEPAYRAFLRVRPWLTRSAVPRGRA